MKLGGRKDMEEKVINIREGTKGAGMEQKEREGREMDGNGEEEKNRSLE